MNAHVHIPVTTAIAHYVTAIWETIPPGVSRELILPKGNVEMVFNLADPAHGILPHQQVVTTAPGCFLQGMNTHTVNVQYTGRQHLFGICLQPHRVKALLGILPSECKNTLIDLTLLRPAFRDLWHRLKEAAAFDERVRIIEATFPVLDHNNCSRTQHFCNMFTDTSRLIVSSIDTLSKELCYSSRQLNRKAQGMFGMSMEELLIHKKFRASVAMMHTDEGTLTDIAYDAGFYDQAHFCRTFKHYTGITAKQYRLQKSGLPFHIFS